MSSTRKRQGKVAIVTGASSGIVAVAAMEFAEQGAQVVLAARTESKLQAVCEDIKKSTGAEVTYDVADFSKDEDNKKIVDTAVSTFGGLHVSFINAGAAAFLSILDATDEAIDSMVGPTFKAVLFGLKHQVIWTFIRQIPVMSKTSDGSSIIVDTSMLGSRVSSGNSSVGIYGCTKAAAELAVKYGAVEGAPVNARVNGLAPGVVITPVSAGLSEEARQAMIKNGYLIQKATMPEDLAPFVAFLASDDAKIMTGAIYPIDAGAPLKMS